MNNNFKRFSAIVIIVIVSLLIGGCVSLSWDGIRKLVHPKDYSSYIQQYSLEFNVPEAIIYAVIKVESNFDPDAESSVGARGLMQMMPATFLELTSDAHLGENLDDDELYDPQVSIKYGTYYLSYLYKYFDNNWDNAICAYNAGMGNVRKWLNDPEYSDGNGNLYPERIPFEETRNYLPKVKEQINAYKELYYTDMEDVKKP